MDNIWILTEEKPKTSVILQIMEVYCADFQDKIVQNRDIKIKPLINNGKFAFKYEVEGLKVGKAENIYIKVVSGSSSFLDFLVFKQNCEPTEGQNNNLLMAVEETKTSDDESRNTGVYQRGSKFAYIAGFNSGAKLYMLYNEELEAREKKPSDTSIFGTNLLLTIGVKILGKSLGIWFNAFNSLRDLISFKGAMRKPPEGNVPIDITEHPDRIEISGRLAKPADAGNIGHDPNIGALSMIAKGIRKLGCNKPIVITKHGVTQQYINKTQGKNKFLYICNLLNMTLENIRMPSNITLPDSYWHYEVTSEKIATILMHVTCEYSGMKEVYHNHAGCERGYFKTLDGKLIALPKKDRNGVNLYLPDLVLQDQATKTLLVIEGKQLQTLNAGLAEIDNYDSIENDYIKPHYRGYNILRGLSIFGGKQAVMPHTRVIIYVKDNGEIILNANAPDCVKRSFQRVGIKV